MALGRTYGLFAAIVLAPVLLIPVGVTCLLVGVFGRVHDPVKVGRLAAAGVASVVFPMIVLDHVQMG